MISASLAVALFPNPKGLKKYKRTASPSNIARTAIILAVFFIVDALRNYPTIKITTQYEGINKNY